MTQIAPKSDDVDTLLIEAACRSGDLVLDAGVYLGRTLREFLNRGAAKVYGFEPNPDLFAHLKREFDYNPSVELYNFALSDFEGDAFLNVPEVNSGAGSIVQHFSAMYLKKKGGAVNSISVPVRRLDDIVLPRCEYWKLDVEGAELSLLLGARETLRTRRPRFLCVESFGNDLNPYGQRFRTLTLLSEAFDQRSMVAGMTVEKQLVAIDALHLFTDPWRFTVERALRRLTQTPIFIHFDPRDPPDIPIYDPSIPKHRAELG